MHIQRERLDASPGTVEVEHVEFRRLLNWRHSTLRIPISLYGCLLQSLVCNENSSGGHQQPEDPKDHRMCFDRDILAAENLLETCSPVLSQIHHV